MQRKERVALRIVLAIVLSTILAGSFYGCVDRPQLEPDAVPIYNRLEAVRIVNDIGDGAIAANAGGKLSDELTARILTIGWQVRDFIEANPTSTYSRVVTAIREGLDATPPALRVQIASYFEAAIAALDKLAKGVA